MDLSNHTSICGEVVNRGGAKDTKYCLSKLTLVEEENVSRGTFSIDVGFGSTRNVMLQHKSQTP